MIGEPAVELRCDVSTLCQSQYGSITANLEVRIGEFVFPGRGWSDFVAVVLEWWLDALDRLFQGIESVDLRFMDGPYLMRVSRIESTDYSLECCADRAEFEIVFQTKVNPMQLLSEIERTAADIIGACAAKNWRPTSVRSLELALKERRQA